MKTKSILIALIGTIAGLLSCADYDTLDDQMNPKSVDLEVIAATDTTVTLRWSQYQEDDFLNYKVYYSRNDIVDKNDSLADSLSYPFDTVKIVRPLASLTRYYFRVITNTVNGYFSASNIVDTITLRSPIRSIQLYDAMNIIDTSLTLRWQKCPVAFDRYRIYQDTTSSIDSTDTFVKTVYTDTTATILGLSPDKAYWYRVYAYKDTNVAAISNSMETRTAQR